MIQAKSSYSLILWHKIPAWTQAVLFLIALYHTQLDTRTLDGGVCESDQLVAEAATHTKDFRHKRRTFTPSMGSEPAIPVIKRLQP